MLIMFLEREEVGVPSVDLVGKPSFYSLLAEPKNYQKYSFPSKSTLGTPTSSLSKIIMSTLMAPYA